MISIKDFTDINYVIDSGVGIITINRPDRDQGAAPEEPSQDGPS